MDSQPPDGQRPDEVLKQLKERTAQLEAAQEQVTEARQESRNSQDQLQALPGQLRQAKEQEQLAQDELARKVEELEQANLKLRQLDTMKDNFLSLLSHELRTPLSAILGYVSILDDELVGPVPEPQHEYLGKVQHEADKLLVLINNTLDMSRLESGRMTFDVRPVNLAEVVQNVLERLEDVITEKRLQVVNTVGEDLPVFQSDEQRLGQILGNLANNAVKFTAAGGTISIRARLDDGVLIVEVEDTGIGITDDYLPHLFQVFGQLDTSSTRVKGGLGLGLALAQGLARAMGGSISVRSEIGKGSTFIVQLPFLEATV